MTAAKLPNVDALLANGLRVLTVCQPSIPMVEMRLWIPFAGWEQRHSARAELLAATIITRRLLDDALAPVGGSLTADVTPERLLISGRVLKDGLPILLETMASVLESAEYIGDDVVGQRDSVAQQIRSVQEDIGVIARRAQLKRRFGTHPIAREIPVAADVASVTPRELQELHAIAVVPQDAVLVLVGDIDVDSAVDQVDTAWKGWRSSYPAARFAPLPTVPTDPLLFVPYDEAARCRISLCAQAVDRTDPQYPALVLANLALSSRLGNRADSYIELLGDGGTVVVDADSPNEHAVETLNDIRHELGRLIYQPPNELEVAAARQFALRETLFAVATQSGLASQLAVLAGADLGLSWLFDILPKYSTTPDQLVNGIVAVARGNGVMSHEVLGKLLRRVGALQRDVLAPKGLTATGLKARELHILELVAKGWDTKEIAQEMSYSERTVKNLIYDVTTRLNLRNRAHAVAYALRAGML